MRDPYLYEGTDVLKNRLNIWDKRLLDEAESDYVVFRLKEVAINPIPGDYDYVHLLQMHKLFSVMRELLNRKGCC